MNDRGRTHWPDCWRDGGARHYDCAVAEAERQRQRAEDAEAALAAVQDYATYYVIAWEEFESDGAEPLEFDEWLREQA